MNRTFGIAALAMSAVCVAQDWSSTAQLQRLKELQAASRQGAAPVGAPLPAGRSADLIEIQRAKSLAAANANIFPPPDMRFPYVGEGSVSVLDDGTLVLEVLGGEVLEVASGEQAAVPPATMAFHLEKEGLKIIDDKGRVFLDRHGVEARLRGVSPDERNVTLFPSEVSTTGEDVGPPRTLLFLSGSMSLAFDEGSNRLSVEITDAESRRSLNLTARVGLAEPPEYGTPGPDPNEIVLQPVVSTSGCSACCGSTGQFCCSINCPLYCSAGCSGDTPFCSCRSSKPK